VKITSKLMSLS